jgi:hypothetical protein
MITKLGLLCVCSLKVADLPADVGIARKSAGFADIRHFEVGAIARKSRYSLRRCVASYRLKISLERRRELKAMKGKRLSEKLRPSSLNQTRDGLGLSFTRRPFCENAAAAQPAISL